ncbi:rCG40612 [Rattus norvegicus]|uniref:RCG40612 n=1 Tax=Rattus norvegicus TaxID=10116 RepID=A6I773_RAT|nr:rCG40612 [Rattus norvegicus]
MPKADKACYEREMKSYNIPHKGETKKYSRIPMCPRGCLYTSSCSVLSTAKKIKDEHPGLTFGDVAKKLGEMWNSTTLDGKQPCDKKAAKLKEKYKKDTAAYRAKGKSNAMKGGG